MLDALEIRIPQPVGHGRAAVGRPAPVHRHRARRRLRARSVLIMDEPTSALAVAEVEAVLALINRVKARGVAVVLITHRLQDLFRVCDRIAVMYEGTKVAERRIAETDLTDIVRLIVGDTHRDRGTRMTAYTRTPDRLGHVPISSAEHAQVLSIAAFFAGLRHLLLADQRRLPLHRQPPQHAAPVGADPDRGGRDDLRHHHRRHRPVGRLDRRARQRAGGDLHGGWACPGRSSCCCCWRSAALIGAVQGWFIAYRGHPVLHRHAGGAVDPARRRAAA